MRYPNCNFPLTDLSNISSSISLKTQNNEPLSLIRLGDGEGLLLSMSPESPETDFRYLTRHLGRAGMDVALVLNLRDQLLKAVQGGDVIGVRNDILDVRFVSENFFRPDLDFLTEFKKCFKLRDVEKNLDFHASRRIALLHKCLADIDFREDVQFCSAWIHYEFQSSGAVFELLQEESSIGLISCRSELPDLLADAFNFDVSYIEIPDMYCDVLNPMSSIEYISQLEHVLSQQLVERPGMIFLVGGGLYGKLYCDLVKRQGGIALDLGSLFDAWLGIPSRRLVYQSMFGTETTDSVVPSQLRFTAQRWRR